MARAPSAGDRQVKVRIPAGRRGRPADPGEGPGRARAGRWPRPGTSTSWSGSASTRCSAAGDATSPSTVPVTFPEAALGTTITVPTLDDPVTLRVPPGHRAGHAPYGYGAAGSRPGGRRPAGDLLVTVDVVVPKDLTDEQRAAVESLAAVAEGTTEYREVEPRGRRAPTPDRDVPPDASRAVYVISVAAELAGVHPQTLRIYERKGLLDPRARAAGAGASPSATWPGCAGSRS